MVATCSSKKEERSVCREPNRKRILALPVSLTWATTVQETMGLRVGPTKAAILGGHGLPLMHWPPRRVEKAQGAFFLELKPKKDASVQYLPLLVIKKPRDEQKVLKLSLPRKWAFRFLTILPSYLKVLQSDEQQKYFALIREYRYETDVTEMQASGSGATPHQAHSKKSSNSLCTTAHPRCSK